MSFFPPGGGAGGGAGGGWPPPPFFNQPPPGIPMQFFQDPSQNQAFPPGTQTDFQQGYNPYAQMPVPIHGQSQSVAPHQQLAPVQAQVHQEIPTSMSSMPQIDNLERGQRASEYKPSSSQDRSRRSHRGDDEDDDPRYARKKRSPVDEQLYRRRDSDERGRQRERGRPSRPPESPPASTPQGKRKVDIDALLQDERLRNVLFAGISKATAKLEQSLQDGKERPDFEPQEAKIQLFPSASTSQKPRSILKRKDEKDSGGSKALSNLSALERTLQMLRGKGDVAAESTLPDSRLLSERKSLASHGALGKLSVYDEGNDEESYRYKSEKHAKETESSASSGSKPFWSVPSKLEASKRESDSFDVKDKMFEEWRQSIGKQSGANSKTDQREREMNRNVELEEYKQSFKKKEAPTEERETDNQEELDSTVQNILQSIGFNFDLSKRMQELARKKRMQEDEGSGIRNVSASFMDKGDFLAEELKASLIRSGSDLSSIDTLIKEVRASSQSSRRSNRAGRSPSQDRQGSGYGREVSPGALRYDRSPREERVGRHSKDTRAIYAVKGTEQWERLSPQSSPSRRHFRDEVSLSPRDSYGDQARKSGQNVSERFRDDGGRNEYFYPEKDYTESPPSVPLLTSLSSRKRNEDLTGGLLKSLRVENFRVMSRSSHDNPDDETYREMRRVILPAKSDRDKSRSPPRTVMRKRSASPIAMRISKERKISPGYYDDYSRRRSPSSSYQGLKSPGVPSKESPKQRTVSPRRQSPPPMRREKSRSPKRRRSRSRTRSRSPYRRRRSRSPRRRSRSPRRRSRSPRRRSRSPRRRSRSPYRGSSKSPLRRRKSPVRRVSPLRKGRRTPPRKIGRSRSRSNDRNSSSSKRVDVSTNKYRLTSTDGKLKPAELAKRDLSKLPEKERKAELKKIVMELENSGDTPNKASEKEEQNAGRVATIMADLTSLSQLDQMTVNKLTAEVHLLNAEQQSKTLANVTARRSKVLALKAYLERLVKVQNELMRKCQRHGLGNKDPQLKANNLSQMETEKEIDRLCAPALTVSFTPDYDQNIKEIQAKLEKEAANLKGKEKNQNKSKQSNTDKKASIEQMIEPSKKTNWTSVAVEVADLPMIAKEETKDETEKTNQKQKSLTKSKKDVYYEYIDSKNHWCSHCHLHLNALDQFYCHLHGKKHFTVISDVPKPWENEVKSVKSKRKVGKAQTRRVKGSEMLFPIAGFYCTLCTIYCGDFKAADQHLKSDGHYDRYLEFIRDNPGYEKKLLLEKTGRGKEHSYPIEKKTTHIPLPTPEKKVKKSKSLRQKEEEEDKEAMNQDNMEPIDMELDEKDIDCDVDVAKKVPKAARKLTNSVAAILSSLPESGANSTGVEMKSNKEDEVKSLDKFLTIETSTEEPVEKQKAKGKGKKSAKIPVIDAKEEVDLLSIPIPEPPKLTTIPLPPATSTVKTLKEVEDEEKRMMGIDVDADEEKQLAPLKRPPPLSQTVSQSDSSAEKAEEKKDIPKPKRLDTLFSKVSKSSSSIIAQKTKSHSVVAEEESELEKKIQQGILEKLEKEKQKLIKRQEKKERLEKKLEEKKLVKMKKKVISDSSSEEDSDSEEEKTSTVKIETEDLVDVSLPTTSSESIEITNFAQNLTTSASGEGIELKSVKDEIIQPQETLEVRVDGAIKVEIQGNFENNAECETNAEDVTNSSVSMDIDSEVTNCDGDKTEELNENVAQDSSHGEVSETMQLMGLDQHTNMEIDGNNAFSTETADKDVQQLTKLCDDRMGQMESVEEIPSLDASIKQVIDTGIVSEEASIENVKKTTEDSSHEELPSPESNKEPNLSTSIDVLDNVVKESVEEDVRALQSESDLLGVLGSSPEALVKSPAPKRSIAKRGGKAGSRASQKIPQSSAGEQDDANISMDDLVALSEVTDDVPKSKEDCEISHASIEKADSESLAMSDSESDKAEEIEKLVKADPIKSVSAVQRGRGGKMSARGKGRGRRVAAKKDSDFSEVSLTTSSCAEETSRQRSVERDGSLEPEAANIVDSTSTSVEAKQNAVEEVAEPVVNRKRRGRSATAKATPAKTGCQTRTRGKKKEVEPESPVAKEENMNLDVGETAGDAVKEEEDGTKSNNVPGLQMESDSTDETSLSVIETVDQTEPTARPTRSRQCKNVTVMVPDGAVQNIAMQATGEEKNKNFNEEAPGSEERPKGRALRSRQAKNTVVGMEEQKKEEDENDSDATITEDVDGAECTSLAAPNEECLLQQAKDETSVLNPTSDLSPTDPQPQRDTPMSGVVTDGTMETSDSMTMTSVVEEMAMTIDPSEVDNLPTAGLDLGEEDDSIDFPDSMAGFTVLDVEGQPDDDGDTDDDL